MHELWRGLFKPHDTIEISVNIGHLVSCTYTPIKPVPPSFGELVCRQLLDGKVTVKSQGTGAILYEGTVFDLALKRLADAGIKVVPNE